MKYTANEHTRFAEQVRAESLCILPQHIDGDIIAAWREAFTPLLQTHIEREGHLQNRGAARYYVTLPFEGVFADPRVFEDPDVLAIVEQLAGKDFVMCQLATDTPLHGSDYQELHRDAPALFPEWGRETPPFQLAVNFPLVDVTAENGPLETTRGTHMMPKSDALEGIAAGKIAVEPIYMKAGDVLIRDVRAIHRGTPNRTHEPRPMVVLGYSRRWLLRPEVSITIPKATLDRLSPAARHMLRFNPVVERLEGAKTEAYQSFAY
jgi:ectoine hydroxylase-related dioxygenase (phytanoyl-CoA dioxygenase family)